MANTLDYEKDFKRVMEEVWSTINFRDLLVIDVGVGYSTRKLVELRARAVEVDIYFKPLMKLNDLKIPLMKCNFIEFPFKNRVADLVLFFFTLHEVDPQLHGKFIQTARQMAPKIMIVEPSPHGCPEYLVYARIWRKAMHSIGKFEDYQPLTYWTKLVEENGFKIQVVKEIPWNTTIPKQVLDKMIQSIVEEWAELSVSPKYINMLKEFGKKARNMKWSNIVVIVAEASN